MPDELDSLAFDSKPFMQPIPDLPLPQTKQMIAAVPIQYGDFLYESAPGQVSPFDEDQRNLGTPIIGIATHDAPQYGVIEIDQSGGTLAGTLDPRHFSRAESGSSPAIVYMEPPAESAMDYEDDEAMAAYLGIAPDEYLILHDCASSGGLEDSADFWRIIAVVLRGRALPIGNVIDVFSALTNGGNG